MSIGRKHFLDLSRHHFKRDLGDISIYGVWIPRDESGNVEPALCLMPIYRAVGKPVIIGLSAAYKYDDPVYMAHKSHEICGTLGFEQGVKNALKISNIINDHLSDLISMPPEPTELVCVGEAKITNQNDGTHRTAQIFDHQPARL